MSDRFPFEDLALAQRLEGAEALGNARFVEARAQRSPDSGATWIEVAGARAMYDGATSPMTQTFGLGLFQTATTGDLEAIETFYGERGAPVFHEVSPLADAGLPALLAARGYRPCEFTSVLYRPLDISDVSTRASGAVHVRLIDKGEEAIYANVSAEGWQEFGVAEFVRSLGHLSGHVAGLRLFLAEIENRPIAVGALAIAAGVAHLAGASTIPAGRKRGAQLALLDHRLRYAATHDCDIALMGALPGSGSQRNAERHGFRIAYTRIKWTR